MPNYTVQPGDTPILVALQHNLNISDLIITNNLPLPYLLFPGQTLTLPGFSPPDPPLAETVPLRPEPHLVQAGDTLFTIAGRYGVSIGAIVLVNDLPDPDTLQIGQSLLIPEGSLIPEPLEPPFSQITLSEPTIIQGRALVVKVRMSEPVSLSGMYEGQSVYFYNEGSDLWWGIVPIHALAEPNVYPISLVATTGDGTETTAFTNVTVVEGPYDVENIQLDASRGSLLTDDLIRQEYEMLIAIWQQVSPQPRWSGPFHFPVAGDPQITSLFGTRRSYNGSPATSFHGGTDFGGGSGTPIYAPAPGTVVLAQQLTLRGNAVVIDHGMGVYSGYWHQTQLAVIEGQEINTGDLIGYMGDTGLVTGPHLHWEIRLNGIAVEPMQWVQQSIP
ncbi:MAG: LysM peptidoglycan-binding domain-containing M23 family metallopeptidase [Anaerolineae bacterium]|nr:LysM peptidoglycan-binding domain-containing M23 family metallopeptidase [Anaerolineae bacterium]